MGKHLSGVSGHLNLQMFQMGEPGASWFPLSLPSKLTFWKSLDLDLASAQA